MGVIQNLTNQVTLARRVRLCRSFWSRLKGLLGTSELARDEACWIDPCNSVHTIGMKYPIDVYFLNKENEVISIVQDLRPNRILPINFRARTVIEFKYGPKRSCKVGDKLSMEVV